MLQSLHIQNFALIEDLHIAFTEGVTIFTGETGAGKSILLDAIGMLAGKRASAEFVRQGTDSFLVEGAFFFIEDPVLVGILEANHIEYDDNQIIISRQFNRNGRGSTLVNGTLVPTAVVRRIGEHLLDIHGQFDSSLIFDTAYHVRILDNLTPKLQAARKDYNDKYHKWQTLCSTARQLQQDDQEKERMLGVLDFQIKEIEDAKLKKGEDEELEEKINRLSHAEKIKDTLRTLLYLLNGGERQSGIVEQLGELRQQLGHGGAYDELFSKIGGKAETICYEIEEIHDSLTEYADSFAFDEHELDAMQGRLAAIEKLKRKYGFTIDEIEAFLQKAKADREGLDKSEQRIMQLRAEIVVLEAELRFQAEALTQLREGANAEFALVMEAALAKLGMPNSRISFQIVPMTDITALGAAAIELYFSANKGEGLQPLAKIASGGEVSRIALALKTSSRDSIQDKTIIFDEIDVGISGQVGLQVAAHIRKLRHSAQVFCITHLPQTAAIADCHYFIYKSESGQRTITQVRRLTEGEHVLEIARMFSGNDPTKASIEAAKQLVAQVHA